MQTSRRRVVAAALLAPAAGLATGGGTQVARAAADTVDMEALVLAAQIDPRRAGTDLTPGAGASVRLVERALRAEGRLERVYVDGHFGTKTVGAYAAWQRSLGYSGLAANGLPGSTSLTRLGEGRWSVVRPLSPGGKVAWRGVTVNTRTRAMCLEAERRAGRTFLVEQGSYNVGGDPTSAGTHDGGGALDLDAEALSDGQRTVAVRSLREVGFAAWLRSPAQGDWPWHIHAVAMSDTDLSSAAQHQVGDYVLGRNGLANRGPDDGPRIPIHTWEEYRRAR
ncbi:peptidoglycan-binding protein [Phycicoccus sp. BSK3Z-2]|uniref:Peptidoglycan-binding protein n=1 Tax=Phycicoccus avicenniae TaxID=2828860 RepID=A0A941I1C9_9MICO|nr:peptidoglycan-binding protein [Phycicoccus avicenniae]MBR7744171.1 peptidoglycan-binding protein [Phycicoccus avicenniae]